MPRRNTDSSNLVLAHVEDEQTIPLLAHRDYAAPSVFVPENLMREARRQKGLPTQPVPAICIFDPDGDFLDYLRATGRAQRHPA